MNRAEYAKTSQELATNHIFSLSRKRLKLKIMVKTLKGLFSSSVVSVMVNTTVASNSSVMKLKSKKYRTYFTNSWYQIPFCGCIFHIPQAT